LCIQLDKIRDLIIFHDLGVISFFRMIIFGILFSEDVIISDHKSLNGRMAHENGM